MHILRLGEPRSARGAAASPCSGCSWFGLNARDRSQRSTRSRPLVAIRGRRDHPGDGYHAPNDERRDRSQSARSVRGACSRGQRQDRCSLGTIAFGRCSRTGTVPNVLASTSCDWPRISTFGKVWSSATFRVTPANRKCHGDGAEIPSMRQAPSGFTYVQASPIPSRTGRLRETAGVPTVLRRWPHALGSPRGPPGPVAQPLGQPTGGAEQQVRGLLDLGAEPFDRPGHGDHAGHAAVVPEHRRCHRPSAGVALPEGHRGRISAEHLSIYSCAIASTHS